jgi:nucleoside diphosphate kinase
VNNRTLPHNLDAERSVLGAVLLRNEAINAAVEVVAPEDFFREAHRHLFDKMILLSERGQAIDLVTLAEELDRAAQLEGVGGLAYITRLIDGVPRSTNVEYYARIVKEKATLRSLIEQAGRIYDVHRERPFYNDLVSYMTSGPVMISVLEGENAIAKHREIMGATDPAKADQGTIRADFASSIEENVVHGSDGPDTARHEIAFFFAGTEICPRTR